MTQAAEGWSSDPTLEEEEEDDEIIYDDDEDEFGLPRIANARRKQSGSIDKLQSQPGNPGGGLAGNSPYLGFGLGAGNRHRADSSDIAEERGPLYPVTRKGEGKILLPQYKDILKGRPQPAFRWSGQHTDMVAQIQ